MKHLLISIAIVSVSKITLAAGLGSQAIGDIYQDRESNSGDWSFSLVILALLSFAIPFWLALGENSPLEDIGWLRVLVLFLGPAFTALLLVYLFG